MSSFESRVLQVLVQCNRIPDVNIDQILQKKKRKGMDFVQSLLKFVQIC